MRRPRASALGFGASCAVLAVWTGACLPAFPSSGGEDAGPDGRAASDASTGTDGAPGLDGGKDGAAATDGQAHTDGGVIDGSTVADGSTKTDGGDGGCSGATPDPCAGSCTNFASDPKNCGACGNACPGAAAGETCVSSACQAYSIATASTPFALTTDGVNVYFLETPSPAASTQIAAVPVGGGKVSGPFAAANAVSIATDAVDVYWGGQTPSTSTGYVSLAPVGSVGSASPVVTNFTDPVEEVYADVADGYLIFGVFCDGIDSVPLKTTAAMQATLHGGGNGCQGSIVAGNNSQVYWANPKIAPYMTTTSGLPGLFVNRGTGSTVTLASAGDIQGIALQGTTVYFTDAAGGTVSKVPSDASTAASAIAVATSPRGLVADASNVYWIDGAGSEIKQVAVTGGMVNTLATGQSATAIAADGSFVYWTNTNAIMRIAK